MIGPAGTFAGPKCDIEPAPEWLELRIWLQQFSPPPDYRQARNWCTAGKFSPKPRMLGKKYFLHRDAVFVEHSKPGTILDQLRASAA